MAITIGLFSIGCGAWLARLAYRLHQQVRAEGHVSTPEYGEHFVVAGTLAVLGIGLLCAGIYVLGQTL